MQERPSYLADVIRELVEVRVSREEPWSHIVRPARGGLRGGEYRRRSVLDLGHAC